MLKYTGYGWGEISIGNWKDRCSYLDDVPNELLGAVEEVIRTCRPSVRQFDAEGYDYIIVFGTNEVYIISNKDDNGGNGFTLTAKSVSTADLAKELISDIRLDIDRWAHWHGEMSDDEFDERRLDLEAFCKVIERRM